MFLRPIALGLFVGALVGGAATVADAQTVIGTPAHDTQKGAELMVAARNALGGDDKLAAIKRLQVKGSTKRVQGGQTLEGDIDMQIELPDKYRVDEEISIPGGAITITRTQALNGANVWDQTEGGNLPGGFGRGGGGRGGDFGGGRQGGGRLGGVIAGALGTDPQGGQGQVDPARAAALAEQQRRTRQTDFTRYLIAFLAAAPEAPAWVGIAKTPKDETADVLEVTTADGTVTRVFLEATTHLPLMMTFSGPAPRPQGGGGRGRGANGGAPAGGNPDAAAGAGGGGFGGRRGGGDPAAAGAPQGAAPQAAAPQGAPGAPGTPGPEGGRGGRGNALQAQPVTVEMYLSDYKVENGLKMPHVITREVNGEIQEELTLKNFKFNPNFKSNTFTQPKQ